MRAVWSGSPPGGPRALPGPEYAGGHPRLGSTLSDEHQHTEHRLHMPCGMLGSPMSMGEGAETAVTDAPGGPVAVEPAAVKRALRMRAFGQESD